MKRFCLIFIIIIAVFAISSCKSNTGVQENDELAEYLWQLFQEDGFDPKCYYDMYYDSREVLFGPDIYYDNGSELYFKNIDRYNNNKDLEFYYDIDLDGTKDTIHFYPINSYEKERSQFRINDSSIVTCRAKVDFICVTDINNDGINELIMNDKESQIGIYRYENDRIIKITSIYGYLWGVSDGKLLVGKRGGSIARIYTITAAGELLLDTVYCASYDSTDYWFVSTVEITAYTQNGSTVLSEGSRLQFVKSLGQPLSGYSAAHYYRTEKEDIVCLLIDSEGRIQDALFEQCLVPCSNDDTVHDMFVTGSVLASRLYPKYKTASDDENDIDMEYLESYRRDFDFVQWNGGAVHRDLNLDGIDESIAITEDGRYFESTLHVNGMGSETAPHVVERIGFVDLDAALGNGIEILVFGTGFGEFSDLEVTCVYRYHGAKLEFVGMKEGWFWGMDEDDRLIIVSQAVDMPLIFTACTYEPYSIKGKRLESTTLYALNDDEKATYTTERELPAYSPEGKLSLPEGSIITLKKVQENPFLWCSKALYFLTEDGDKVCILLDENSCVTGYNWGISYVAELAYDLLYALREFFESVYWVLFVFPTLYLIVVIIERRIKKHKLKSKNKKQPSQPGRYSL